MPADIPDNLISLSAVRADHRRSRLVSVGDLAAAEVIKVAAQQSNAPELLARLSLEQLRKQLRVARKDLRLATGAVAMAWALHKDLEAHALLSPAVRQVVQENLFPVMAALKDSRTRARALRAAIFFKRAQSPDPTTPAA